MLKINLMTFIKYNLGYEIIKLTDQKKKEEELVGNHITKPNNIHIPLIIYVISWSTPLNSYTDVFINVHIF